MAALAPGSDIAPVSQRPGGESAEALTRHDRGRPRGRPGGDQPPAPGAGTHLRRARTRERGADHRRRPGAAVRQLGDGRLRGACERCRGRLTPYADRASRGGRVASRPSLAASDRFFVSRRDLDGCGASGGRGCGGAPGGHPARRRAGHHPQRPGARAERAPRGRRPSAGRDRPGRRDDHRPGGARRARVGGSLRGRVPCEAVACRARDGGRAGCPGPTARPRADPRHELPHDPAPCSPRRSARRRGGPRRGRPRRRARGSRALPGCGRRGDLRGSLRGPTRPRPRRSSRAERGGALLGGGAQARQADRFRRSQRRDGVRAPRQPGLRCGHLPPPGTPRAAGAGGPHGPAGAEHRDPRCGLSEDGWSRSRGALPARIGGRRLARETDEGPGLPRPQLPARRRLPRAAAHRGRGPTGRVASGDRAPPRNPAGGEDGGTMRVNVLLFAMLRQRAGTESLELELPEGATAADALAELAARDGLGELIGRMPLRVAVNREYVPDSTGLASGDELAVIPPVSGGAPLARVTPDSLSTDRLLAAVASPASGATVLFMGTTRDLASLDYEAYAEMAEQGIAGILESCVEAHGLEAAAAEHRVGTVPLGEPSVLVAVSAPHRAEAFAGAREAIDRIKEEAPIWKTEAGEPASVAELPHLRTDPAAAGSDGQSLSHLDAAGEARMVDVSEKQPSERRARAEATVLMAPETARALTRGDSKKGDVLGTARIAAIQAAKRTAELIPLAHQLPLTHVEIDFGIDQDAGRIEIVAAARTADRTGVEMEAMTAAAVAALTIYDMTKGLERGIEIAGLRLLEKSGGRHDWQRDGAGVNGERPAETETP